MELPELYNGQIWKQKGFPCFTTMVLMLDHVDGNLMFCKVGLHGTAADDGHSFLVTTDKNGKWQYTEDELLTHLRNLQYTPAGRGQIIIVEEKA